MSNYCTLYKVSPVPLQWPQKSPSDSKTMDDCIKSDNGHSVAPEHYALRRFAASPLRRLAIIFKMAWNSEASSCLFMSPEAIIRGNSEHVLAETKSPELVTCLIPAHGFFVLTARDITLETFEHITSCQSNIILINDSSCLEAT